MIKKIRVVFLGGLVLAGSGFSDEAFDALIVKIAQTSLSRKEVKKLGFVDEDDKTDIDYDGFVYTLDFRNKSVADLNDLKVECRFFYTVESIWRDGSPFSYEDLKGKDNCEQKYYEDSLDVSLRSGERYKAETRSFVIESWALTSGYYFGSGDADKADADPDGLWVRISYKTPSGKTVTRDFCEPESLFSRVSWEGKSI